MKILELDVDRIGFELIKPEAKAYEESSEKKFSIEDAMALFVSIESGDDEAVADKAIADLKKHMAQLKRSKVVLYPFAHLSGNLEEPKRAMQLFDYMFENVSKEFETVKAPFGWNKKLEISVKGHPLAERSRTFSSAAQAEPKLQKKAKPIDTSIVRKSDVSGLPETDHRTIGERLDIFSQQEVSPGMIYWHANGYVIYRQLLVLIREKLDEYNYEELSLPALANIALWKVSGHLDHYNKNMFMLDSDGEQLGIKPMNCPSTILVYKSRKWSYRDLPWRTAVNDKLYRNEISGSLTGMFRVRELTMDDGHVFCREDQVENEIKIALKMIQEVLEIIGMDYIVRLSTMPEDHLGDEKLWEQATENLKAALKSNKIKYEIKEGEGAFYGPKIEFELIDAMKRRWQGATIQLDYQLPLRFGIEYTGEDGKAHTPVLIHRAILGTLERFIGALIEHYQGKFPTWLAPVQVKVVSISEQSNAYAANIFNELKKGKIRAKLDDSDRTLDYKIREAQMQKVPYIVIVGKKEEDAGTIAVRARSGGQKFGVKISDFVEKIQNETAMRVKSPN
ncbi:MAG: threonine--tRNA ligase [Candidatus Micrarchaeota archaeon]|nr:threonine--tRNA ligase [Candidatus Micrarchaeota archaeon]